MADKKSDGACGHINRHYLPTDGSGVTKMVCTLPAGHAPVSVRREVRGEDKLLHEIYTFEVIHQASYKIFKKGIWKDATASWSDDAGAERPAELKEKHAS